jgi:hypothetical protein
MISRRIRTALLWFGLICVVVAAAPYLTNFVENRNGESMPPMVKLADLKTGSFVEIVLPASRAFVLRDFDDQVHVFSVPYSDTAYWLPEFDWSHPAIPCAEFSPDNKEGMLIKDGAFRCRQPDHGEFFRYEHSWAYSGRNLGYRTSDLKIPDFELTDDAIVLKQHYQGAAVDQ